MLPVSNRGRLAVTSKAAVIILPLLFLALFPDDLAAQGLPVETGSHIPVALWFIGAAVLGLVLAYGIMRNRARTRAEKNITDQANEKQLRRGKPRPRQPLTRASFVLQKV
jgi:uncharacterized integral membrane protein